MLNRRLAPLLLLLPLMAPGATATPPQGGAARSPDDLTAVRRTLAARIEYQASLEALREFYLRTNDLERARWVEDELLGFHRISKPAYRLDLDVPPPNLQPQHSIPEANELYRRAMSYKGKGWLSAADDNMRRAEILFQQLLAQYPQSDKIADVAYQLGEIYESRAFKQFRRAAAYYERHFQWNPRTNTDARLRAARLYDKVLHDRGRAAQLYREVMAHDGDQRRVDEARKRLQEISVGPPG
ncbi:MAG TPA: hypothetical protein PKD86_10720 [Gemmatales bacterium]|nr:hypothetical protein [Gemmatales bacterium]HMP59818.1 hypothetical protein [Gemmatales bacterium]